MESSFSARELHIDHYERDRRFNSRCKSRTYLVGRGIQLPFDVRAQPFQAPRRPFPSNVNMQLLGKCNSRQVMTIVRWETGLHLFFIGNFSATDRNAFEMTEKIKSFWSEWLKICAKNSVLASFNTTVRQNDRDVSLPTMSHQKWRKCFSEKKPRSLHRWRVWNNQQFFNRKSISRNTTHRQSYNLTQIE